MLNWIEQRLPIVSMLRKGIGGFPIPRNINVLWNFGSIAMVMLIVMIVSGALLAMHYTADTTLSFQAVERITREMNGGWLLRSIHTNGASMFFVAVYIHTLRGLYYGSYKEPRELLWILGIIILLLMMATAFTGYVLPWSQLSYWSATVITNLFGAIPWVGDTLVSWLRGGEAVDNPTLTRFFVLHFLLPFIILGVIALHVISLHVAGSNNPLGIEPESKKDLLPFYPTFFIKHARGAGVFMAIFIIIAITLPSMMSPPDHLAPADPMVTPPHLVPAWYFLPFYGILRSVTADITLPFTDIVLISSTLGGALLMFGSVAVMLALPWLDTSPVRSARFRPLFRKFFWLYVLVCFTLGWMGAMPPDGITTFISQLCAVLYFAFFLVALPLLNAHEKTLPLPPSIHEAMHADKYKKRRLHRR